jgi:adenylosuccinate synthase
MVVDLQFGSTGKGQIAGTIGRKWEADTVVCANGPNAGHTYCWTDGIPGRIRRTINTVMPVCSVLPTVRNVLIGPGAVVDIEKLADEIRMNADLLKDKRLIIHPNAAIVMQEHRDREKQLIGIGSTMKGTAEAVIEKMRRVVGANIAQNWRIQLEQILLRSVSIPNFEILVREESYNQAVDSSVKMMVEGAQGSSLSMHSKFYPHTTSRDVSINQIWADCRLPGVTSSWRRQRGHNADADIQVVGVARTYPIRVANRIDENGALVGYSGGCYPDQTEITWAEIGREPELTTVTRLPRRLFTFSTQQILEAVRYNAPTSIALTFCDYLPSHNDRHPQIPEGMMPYPVGPSEHLSPCVAPLVRRLEAAAGCDVNYLSFGPNDTDVFSIDNIDGRDFLCNVQQPHARCAP